MLACDSLGLLSREADAMPADMLTRFTALADRRLGGEPVSRLVGHREFYGLDFELNHATLVPRPETELLVDIGIERLAAAGASQILDLGTGSGAIAVALLVNLAQARAVATDLSAEALAMAGRNARRHDVADRLEFRQGSWFGAVEPGARYDLIVSNPPYIESGTIPTLAREVREHDPLLALDGGPDGLAPYREIARQAMTFLAPGGAVAVEIGATQGREVAALFAEAGFAAVSIRNDLAGLDRAVVAHQLL